MNEGTAIDLAEKMMEHSGINNYLLRYRHLQLLPSEKRLLKGENHLYFLLQPEPNTRVFSKAGIYNLLDKKTNEMQLIHRGDIEVENLDKNSFLQVRFIQVIPTHKTKD
jgi:hypothetical protein